jgi:WD40 repeat protein
VRRFFFAVSRARRATRPHATWTLANVKNYLEEGRKRLHARLARRGVLLGTAVTSSWLMDASAHAACANVSTDAMAKAALSIATGQAALEAFVPESVVALAKGATGSMIFSRLAVLALVLVMGFGAAGVSAWFLPETESPEPQDARHAVAVEGNNNKIAAPIQKPNGPPAPADDPQARARYEALPGNAVRLGEPVLNSATGVSPRFSADGQTLLTFEERVIREWDLTTLRLRRNIPILPNTTYERTLSIGPDGNYMPAGRLGDPGGSAGTTRGQVAVTPDGKFILGISGYGGITCLNRFTGELRYEISKPGARLYFTLAMAPDGKRFAAGGRDQRIHIFAVADGKPLGIEVAHPAPAPEVKKADPWSGIITNLAWSPDSKALASSVVNDRIRVWDAATGKLRWAAPEKLSREGPVAFLGDADHILMATPDAADGPAKRNQPCGLAIWTVGRDKPDRGLDGGFGGMAITVSNDGKLVAADNRGQGVRVWDAKTGKSVHTFPTAVRCAELAFSADDSLLAAGGNGLHLFDLATGKDLRATAGHAGQVLDGSLSSDGMRAATIDRGGSVIIWDTTTGAAIRRWHRAEPLAAVAISPDGQSVFIGTTANVVHGFSVKAGKELWKEGGHVSIRMLAVAPDGKTLGIGCDRDLTVWLRQPDTGKLNGKLVGAVDRRPFQDDWGFGWSPDSRSIAMPHRVPRLHRTAEGKRVLPAWAGDAEFDIDAGELGAEESRGVAVWDVASRKRNKVLANEDGTGKIVWSADGKSLAIAGPLDNEVAVYDSATWKVASKFKAHSHNGIAYAKNVLFVGGVARDSRTGKALHTFVAGWTEKVIGCPKAERVLIINRPDATATVWSVSK